MTGRSQLRLPARCLQAGWPESSGPAPRPWHDGGSDVADPFNIDIADQVAVCGTRDTAGSSCKSPTRSMSSSRLVDTLKPVNERGYSERGSEPRVAGYFFQGCSLQRHCAATGAPRQCRKWRTPVNTIGMPCSSAAAITSASRMDPPTWTTARTPAFAATSTLSRKGKKQSEAKTLPTAEGTGLDHPQVLALGELTEGLGGERGGDDDLGHDLADPAGGGPIDLAVGGHDATKRGAGVGVESPQVGLLDIGAER